jgi:biotin operon repressor
MMNATQTALLETLAVDPFTVNDLVAQLEKSETTIRKNLKELEAEGKVRKDTGHWFLIIETEQHASIEELEAAIAAGEAATSSESPKSDAVEDSTNDESETAGEPAATRKYQRHQTPTTRTVRTNQITGARLQVLKNGETAEDGTAYKVSTKWMTVCLDHMTIGEFARVLDAHFASTYPTFCPTCSSKMTEDQIGRRRAARTQP